MWSSKYVEELNDAIRKRKVIHLVAAPADSLDVHPNVLKVYSSGNYEHMNIPLGATLHVFAPIEGNKRVWTFFSSVPGLWTDIAEPRFFMSRNGRYLGYKNSPTLDKDCLIPI